MICLDTMILIWGVQRNARSGQELQIERTSRFLESLPDAQPLMVPSVVLGEYLAGFSEGSARQAQVALITRRFFVPPLDAPAAALAAEILASSSATEPASTDRRVLKADAQIIATAIVHGARKLVTQNLTEYRRLAAGRIEVVEIPVIAIQNSIFPEASEPN